ncbi:hypothetical protein MMC21_003813 [Puttea exsequens]|nr:hypothetical protein [Puttea exsequens]
MHLTPFSTTLTLLTSLATLTIQQTRTPQYAATYVSIQQSLSLFPYFADRHSWRNIGTLFVSNGTFTAYGLLSTTQPLTRSNKGSVTGPDRIADFLNQSVSGDLATQHQFGSQTIIVGNNGTATATTYLTINVAGATADGVRGVQTKYGQFTDQLVEDEGAGTWGILSREYYAMLPDGGNASFITAF